ncbi:MAG: cytochrome c biogenesis protein CcsA [Burkholderiales bacterium]|nr:cytochrome c biogenesis protein CcsA [Burkholderiales bacterium]
MTANAVFYVFGAILYLVATWGIYKSFQHETQQNTFWIRPVITAGLLIQAFLIYEALFLHGTPHFGMALALSITFFCCTLLLLIETFLTRLSTMLVFVLPLSAASMLLPLLLPGTPLGPQSANIEFRIHLLLAILAYSLMTMALVQSLLLVAVHNQVRHKKLGNGTSSNRNVLLDRMPSVMDMEKDLFRLIWLGFIALTFAIGFGLLYSQELYGVAFRYDHKTIVTTIAWCIFGILLAGHHFLGWRGKFAARWTVIGFVMLMVAYIGVRFVLEVIQ